MYFTSKNYCGLHKYVILHIYARLYKEFCDYNLIFLRYKLIIVGSKFSCILRTHLCLYIATCKIDFANTSFVSYDHH